MELVNKVLDMIYCDVKSNNEFKELMCNISYDGGREFTNIVGAYIRKEYLYPAGRISKILSEFCNSTDANFISEIVIDGIMLYL